MNKRVVITGMGQVTSLGDNIKQLWNNIVNGKCGISKITKFDVSEFASKIGAEIIDFDPGEYITKKDAKRMGLFTQYAIVATQKAMANSEFDINDSNAEEVGVIVGSGIGGIEILEKQVGRLIKKGPRRVSPFFIPMMISNMAPGQISIYTGAKGPNLNTVTACASGTTAIGEAYETIKRGDAIAMITGGTEAAVSPSAIAGFASMRALSTRNDQPGKASRPFDKERDGFIIGEGSGMLVLEDMEHACQRDAKIYAEIIGYGASGDAYHMTQPAPDGEGAARAMEMAVKKANLNTDEVDYINAHGTSTLLNDKYETMAIKSVFGDYADEIVISSTKSMTGHLLGAAGGVETIITVLAINDKVVPPTINYENPDPECDLDYVPNTARKVDKLQIAMTNSFGFGGQNACLLLKEFKK